VPRSWSFSAAPTTGSSRTRPTGPDEVSERARCLRSSTAAAAVVIPVAHDRGSTMIASLLEPVARTAHSSSPSRVASAVMARGGGSRGRAAVRLRRRAVGDRGGVDVIGVLTVGSFPRWAADWSAICCVSHAARGSVLRHYPATAFLGGAIAIAGYQVLTPVPFEVRAPLDAAALGLFCVVGAMKALDFRHRRRRDPGRPAWHSAHRAAH
jgi:hypothetical protein